MITGVVIFLVLELICRVEYIVVAFTGNWTFSRSTFPHTDFSSKRTRKAIPFLVLRVGLGTVCAFIHVVVNTFFLFMFTGCCVCTISTFPPCVYAEGCI